MQKIRFFSPPLVALLLAACSSSPDSATQQDPNELPPSQMQPVAGSGASQGSYSWSGDVQAAPMPASMK